MSLAYVGRPRPRLHLGWRARLASYLAAAAAGAVSVALWRRKPREPRATRIATLRVFAPADTPTVLANAGWAEILDARGSVLGRARVMLPAAAVDGEPVAGELRSLRLTSGQSPLLPGRYWVRFETGKNAHAVEVQPHSGPRSDIVTIRWDDLDLPASLVERAAN